MNLNEFINTYEGKRVDENGNDRGYYNCFDSNKHPWCHQCVSLVKFYQKIVFGLKSPASWDWKRIIQWMKKINQESWENIFIIFDRLKVESKDNSVLSNKIEPPKAWDIISWDRDTYWHVAIVLSADRNNIIYLEQNGWSGDWYSQWANAIKKASSTYLNIIWWWRHKSLENNTPIVDDISNNPKPSSPQIQPNFNIWNEERPYDNVTKEEMDDMIVKAFGLNVDYYTIFNKYWKDLIRDPNATRVDYCTRAGRGNNTLTFENFGYKFDRITIAKFIINIQTLWTGVELPIATESEVREIFYKYFPNQNPSDVFRRYFPEIQETNNFLFDIRRAWYQSNKIKNEFKHDRFYILSCILDMKKKLG